MNIPTTGLKHRTKISRLQEGAELLQIENQNFRGSIANILNLQLITLMTPSESAVALCDLKTAVQSDARAGSFVGVIPGSLDNVDIRFTGFGRDGLGEGVCDGVRRGKDGRVKCERGLDL